MVDAIYLLAGFGIILLASSFNFDKQLAKAFSKLEKTGFWKVIFAMSSTAFIACTLLVVAGLMFFLPSSKKAGLEGVWLLVTGIMANFVVTYVIKFMVRRKRQKGEEYIKFTKIPDYSFPSSHSSLAFVVYALIGSHFTWLKIIWLVFATYLAFGRLYLEEHYLSDVIAGILLGYYCGVIFAGSGLAAKAFQRITLCS